MAKKKPVRKRLKRCLYTGCAHFDDRARKYCSRVCEAAAGMNPSPLVPDARTRQRIKEFHATAGPIIAQLRANRDALRNLLSHFDDIKDTAEEALETFEQGMDELSALI